MTESLNTLIKSLPPEYLMIMVPILIIFAVFYVLPRIRRDDQGKLYFYSTIEQSKRNAGKMDNIRDQLNEVDTRLTTLAAVAHSVEMENLKQSVFIGTLPAPERIYAGLKYIHAGGNSSVASEVKALIATHQDTYRTVTLLHPELALPGESS